jgi:choline dehydrogenase-like flavoprotein
MSKSKTDLTRTITSKAASENLYDAVIVGAGIAGAIIAKELSKKGKRVLIVEAGPGKNFSLDGYQKYLETFYSAASKDNQSPYKRNPNAPMPRSTDIRALRPGEPNTDGYWVQNGPFVSDSTYSRVVGGTTMHWEGKTIRMLREDFKMRTNFGVGLDWPISLDDIKPYYNMAEFEIGVSGDAEGQKRVGAEFDKDYVYPMMEMPPTYLDKVVERGISGMEVELDNSSCKLTLETFPQGRNGIPNEKYKPWNGGKNFVPVGAVSLHQAEVGERCQGNTNCVPICPVQAKYDARKTLAVALSAKGSGNDDYYVDLIYQAVASKVIIDSDSGKVREIEIKIYHELEDPGHETVSIRGTVFILAANAVETARLMLASGLPGTSGLMGRNLMDHPYLLSWGLLPEIAGVGNGTVVTSGISNLRSGAFRNHQAAFAVDIHNDGWGWATGSPISNLLNTVDNLNKFGADLRNEMYNQISKQLLLANMVEMVPEYSNRVSVDPRYKDALGNPRPVVTYSIPDYSLSGIAYARQLNKFIFQRLGAEDYTKYDPLDYGYVNYNGEGYALRGGNHIAGTHIMGTTKNNSVVNSYQKSWDHENLYLVGAGSMPTIGTSNTSLTIAALCFRTSEAILADLK